MKPVAAPSMPAAELASRVGDAHVLVDPAELAPWTVEGVTPAAVVSPGSAEEVSAVLRLANQRDWAVVPAGGMTQQGLGFVPASIDVLLRTRRMAEVLHYDPADLTVGVGAGITLAELNALLAERGQMLPLDPPRPDQATLGGILATAAQGPMKHGFGGPRDYCIGIRFVTGDGVVAKGGGRVVKNVAGYDLMKLMIGSQGSLGVIVSANFKVVPRPRGTRTLVAEFSSLDEALRFRDALQRSPLTPMCLEIVSPHAHEYLRDPAPPRDPDDMVPGAAQAPPHRWSVLLRAGGSDAVLARYRAELGTAVTAELDGDVEARCWQRLADFAAGVLARHRNAMIVQLGGTIQSAGASLAALEKAALDYNFLPAAVGRIGVGSLLAAFVPLAVDPPSAVHFAAAISALRASLPPDAFAVVLRCPPEAKQHFDVWGAPTSDREAMRTLRRTLDPRGVLNRGRFLIG